MEVEEAQATIEEWRQMFLATSNPYYFWLAFMNARQHVKRGVLSSLPEWLLEELDTVADRVCIVAFGPEGMPDAHWTKQMAGAFGFGDVESLGGRDPRNTWPSEMAGLKRAKHVRLLLAEGHKLTIARQLVAESHAVGETTVRRAWEQFQMAASVCSEADLRRDVEAATR